MRVLLFMTVCSALPGLLTCTVEGGDIPERSGVYRTVTGTTADVRGALATHGSASALADTVRSEGSLHGVTASQPPAPSGTTPSTPLSPAGSSARSGLEPLVPNLRGRTFSLGPGPRRFLRKLAFSPGVGRLGDEPLYLMRMAYNPNEWLGWEAHIAHNRGKTVHALFNMLNAQVRYPVPFRVQPYLTGGFGVVLVFPGTSLNADPVTENALAAGGGIELYLREDLALRGEWRRTSVFARDRYTDESTVYAYDELTFGLSFYRQIGDGM